MIVAVEQPEHVCCICGDRVENGRSAVCYGCHLDRLIPPGYQRKERYVHGAGVVAGGRATKHPLTNVPILDSTPLRLSQRDLPAIIKIK